MNCPYCGAEILENASFCVSCGAQITREFADLPQAQTQTTATAQPQQAQTTAQPQQAQTTAQPQQAQTTVYINNAQPAAPALYDRSKSGGMLMAAFILNLIATIGFGFLVIPLAWMIPMTVHSYGIYKGTKPNTTAFAVCTLIFLNLISGILMLVAGTED